MTSLHTTDLRNRNGMASPSGSIMSCLDAIATGDDQDTMSVYYDALEEDTVGVLYSWCTVVYCSLCARFP